MRRTLLTCLLAAVTAVSPVRASSPAPIPLQPADVFKLHAVSDVQISPDARQVAYVRQTPDIMTDRLEDAIWLVDVAGLGQSQLARSAHDPRWSADGTAIAYVASQETGHDRLFVAAVDGRSAPRALTDGTVSPGDPAWARDGSAIAYTAFVVAEPAGFSVPAPEKPQGASWAPSPHVITGPAYQADGAGFLPSGHESLFVVSTRTGETRRVETGGLDVDGTPSWAPDGSFLVFSAHGTEGPARPETSAIYQATLSTGQVRQLSPGTGSDSGASISPDGANIAYVHTDKTGAWHFAAWAMRSNGSDPHPVLASLDRDVSQIGWARDGTLFLSYEDHAVGVVARMTSDQHAVEVASQADDDAFSLADNGSIGFVLGSPDRPAAAAVSDREGQRVLTHLDDDLLRTRKLGAVSPFDATSSYDGKPVPGFVITPPNYQQRHRYPTILWIHGGPYGDDGPQWQTDLQLLAAAGYVVLHANPRGSRSYGFAHTDGLPFAAPGHDYDDLMSVVDAAVAQGIADPDRLYVAGQSYGGIMTSWIIGHTKRFRAAVAGKPAVDFTAGLATDQYESVLSDPRGTPWEHHDAWWQTSPLSLVGQVETPTMVIVGEDDRRTPITQAEMLYDALCLRGVPSVLVVYPEASHETLGRRPSQLVSIAAAMLDWFGRYQ